MLHTFRSHRPQFLRARNKTQCSKANEKDFSVSLAASLSAQMPTSHSEHDRSGAWMHFSTPGICWGCHTGRCSWLSTPCGTGVASQLFTGSEISKPVLQVRFTKHLPTSLMLTVAAPLLPYHGRLCTSFPGAKLSKGQIFSGSSVRYETRALTHNFVKYALPTFPSLRQWSFNVLCPKTPDSDHTHVWMPMAVVHYDSSSSVEESKNQSLLLF